MRKQRPKEAKRWKLGWKEGLGGKFLNCSNINIWGLFQLRVGKVQHPELRKLLTSQLLSGPFRWPPDHFTGRAPRGGFNLEKARGLGLGGQQ